MLGQETRDNKLKSKAKCRDVQCCDVAGENLSQTATKIKQSDSECIESRSHRHDGDVADVSYSKGTECRSSRDAVTMYMHDCLLATWSRDYL